MVDGLAELLFGLLILLLLSGIDPELLFLGITTTRPDSLTETDFSIFAAGEVDGVETTDAFDDEDNEDGNRTECGHVLAAFDVVVVVGVVDLLIHEIISWSIIESIFSRAVVGLGTLGLVDGGLVGELLAATSVDGLFVDEATTSGDTSVEGDALDDVAVVGVVVGAVVDDALAFCWCNRLRRRSRVSLNLP